jgi:hypothetical protein
MRRYFFHIRLKAGPVVPDKIGIHVHNLAASRAAAKEVVREYTAEKQAAGETIDVGTIEIADSSGLVVAVIDFDEDVGPSSDEP